MTVRTALGLGSNVGDRRSHLAAAVAAFGAVGEIVGVSSLYETSPIGGPTQGDYLNAVIVVEADLAPHRLLEVGRAAEAAAGRTRRVRWGPRTLDVDVLLHGDEVIDEPGLRVPHPRMAERRFVLQPLAEVWPGAVVPGLGPVADLLDGVMDQEVRVVAGPDWAGRGG